MDLLGRPPPLTCNALSGRTATKHAEEVWFACDLVKIIRRARFGLIYLKVDRGRDSTIVFHFISFIPPINVLVTIVRLAWLATVAYYP